MLSVPVFVITLAGCSSSQTEETAANTGADQTDEAQDSSSEELESGKVTLRVWAEEANFEAMNIMIDNFKKEYAGQADFDIILEASGDADTRTNVLGDIHNAADVFSMPDDQLYSLIAGGAISPVVNQAEVKNANIEEAVSAASYKDTLYAYPYAADNGYFLYYDKRYLSESDVQTMDGILAVAAANEKKISMELNSGWYLYSFFGNTGLEFGINDDGVTNYCNWNATEGTIKGVDVAQALLDITLNPGFVAQPDGLFMEGVRSGEIIAGVSGVWNAVGIQEEWGANYGACKLPTYTCNGQQIQMSSFTGYKMFAVNTYSKHLGWAHKLADWMTNEQSQQIRFEMRSTGPSNKVAAASDEVAKVPAIGAIIDQSQFGTLQRVGNSYWNACTNFADTIAAGNPENMPLQDLVDRLANGIEIGRAHV